MNTIASLAAYYADQFEISKRTNGKEFTRIKDKSEVEPILSQLIRDCHPKGAFLDDWLYSEVASMFSDIANFSDDADDWEEMEIEADIYYNELSLWFHECRLAHEFCCTAKEELGLADCDIYTAIGWGQWYARDMIKHKVGHWLEERLREAEETSV